VARALSPAKVSGVTIAEDGEGQPSAQVIVPDNQLSLAIGKKGQNARLAAKLTGMRIDIKSESEVETERADAEETRATLTSLGATAEVAQALEAAGLSSPRAIVEAGRAALVAVPAVGDLADKIYAAAEAWVAAHAAPEPAAEVTATTDGERPPADA
jgi:transcription termination/antitermination protein NusA